MTRLIDCRVCGGTGWLPSLPEGRSECTWCNGTGKIPAPTRGVKIELEAHTLLTSLTDVMVKALEADPRSEGVKCVVMLDDGKLGGICVHGYENGTDAAVDLFIHLRAMFNAVGKELSILPIETANPERN